MEKKEFIEIFNYTKNKTDNFKNITESIIKESPRVLFIFRLILNINQRKFSKLIRISNGSLWDIESGKRKRIKRLNVTEICKFLRAELDQININKINLKELYKRYTLFKSYSKLDTKRAKEIRKKVLPRNNVQKGIKVRSKNIPDNEFEEYILNILKKNKIDFELHAIIKAKNKSVVVDFAIPNSKNPKYIIEVKQSKSKNIKRQYDLMHWYAIILDHKIHHIKLNHSKIKGIIILSSKYRPLIKISPYIKAELLDTDRIFIDSNISKLIEYIKQ